MDWEILIGIFIAGVLLCTLAILLQTAALANQGWREHLRDLWHTFFGAGEGK
jgi:hypothetical protein